LRQVSPGDIGGVHLASTLATNATVENKAVPSGLLLIGYDTRDVEESIKQNRFGTAAVESIPGGHDEKGNEKEPLDEERVLEATRSLLTKNTRGIAISGYFSVRNPTHEIRAQKAITQTYPDISVTCGHELASELDAFKRATTAAINAGLIPILSELLKAVKNVLKRFGINAPLSIIKGDGSLVNTEWAESHPVETVVSGPAASAMGARFLAEVKKSDRCSWVVDVGGTTTDIICLDKIGNPLIRNDGANIGGHRILTKTIDIRTIGLGGDSRVRRTTDGAILIGPRRVIPNAVAASQDSGVENLLHGIENSRIPNAEPLLVFPGKQGEPENSIEEIILKKLEHGPSSLEHLMDGETSEVTYSMVDSIDSMDGRGLVKISSFTPTDALIAMGKLDGWHKEASLAGARILAKNRSVPFDWQTLCEKTCVKVSEMIAGEVFKKALLTIGVKSEAADSEVLDLGITTRPIETAPGILLRLNGNMIGVGAPAWAFMPEAANILGETAKMPENASVGGAVGAAVGSFFMSHSLLVTPLVRRGGYRVHLPDGIKDYKSLDSAVSESIEFMMPWLEARAVTAGGHSPKIEWSRHDEVAVINNGAMSLHLWTRVAFNVREEEHVG
jgi:N-methylhydantoinase A/oxoprolinase/acetone carboxylase beta subunit